MSTHNICFYGELETNDPKIIKYSKYSFLVFIKSSGSYIFKNYK